jgi:hypothetical protein
MAMAASSAPGPGDDALSAREKEILAGIESDLAIADPRFAQRLARPLHGRPPVRWWPLSLRCSLLLIVVLVVLAAATVLVPSWALLGLITTLVVVPWILLCAVERNRT